MKISDQYLPEKCAFKGKEGKEALKHMFVEKAEGDRGVLSATDGVMLVRLPVKLSEGDKEGTVSVDALTQAREYVKDGEYEIHLRDKAVIDVPELHAEHVRFNLVAFPETKKIFPKTKPRAVIAFSAKRLRDIADAMGCDAVLLEIRSESEIIVVRPAIGECLEVGAFMPVNTGRTAKEKQGELK
jgi:hypothetical protein